MNYAVQSGDLAGVKAGIANGVNVNGSNQHGLTPMHTAAIEGNVTILRELAAAGGEIDSPDCSGQTPLIYASGRGHLAVARYLVDQGANVNRAAGDANRTCPDRSHAESSPLSSAAWSNKPEMVRFLLSKGANRSGKRAFAFSLLDNTREPVATQLRQAGYKADEETTRLVAQVSAQQAKQTAQAEAKAQGGDDGVEDAIMDAVVTGALMAVIGF